MLAKLRLGRGAADVKDQMGENLAFGGHDGPKIIGTAQNVRGTPANIEEVEDLPDAAFEEAKGCGRRKLAIRIIAADFVSCIAGHRFKQSLA